MKLALLLATTGMALLLSRAPIRSAPEPALDDLAWMAGHWSGEEGGTYTEEVWLEPRGGLMLAVNRSVREKGRTSFEYLRIEQRPDGPVYVASPGGKGATEFPLADVGERFALFANPEHDFPREIRYELTASGALHARVSGVMGGAEAVEEWTWSRRR